MIMLHKIIMSDEWASSLPWWLRRSKLSCYKLFYGKELKAASGAQSDKKSGILPGTQCCL